MADPEELRPMFEAKLALELGVKDTGFIFARHNAMKGQYIDPRIQMGWFAWICAHDLAAPSVTTALDKGVRDGCTEKSAADGTG